VETIDGRVIRVEIPPGVQHDGIIRVPGEGVRTRDRSGDLVLRVRIRPPEGITARERALYRRLLRIEEEHAERKGGLVARYLSKIGNRGR
jgi:DnaJ-class molecular chaperone